MLAGVLQKLLMVPTTLQEHALLLGGLEEQMSSFPYLLCDRAKGCCWLNCPWQGGPEKNPSGLAEVIEGGETIQGWSSVTVWGP